MPPWSRARILAAACVSLSALSALLLVAAPVLGTSDPFLAVGVGVAGLAALPLGPVGVLAAMWLHRRFAGRASLATATAWMAAGVLVAQGLLLLALELWGYGAIVLLFLAGSGYVLAHVGMLVAATLTVLAWRPDPAPPEPPAFEYVR